MGDSQRQAFTPLPARIAKHGEAANHSNIVSVFGVGQDAGLHYFVMQYIRGVGLDKVLVELHELFHTNPSSGSPVNGAMNAN